MFTFVCFPLFQVLELHESLQHNPGVILVGPSGSGKTVCYETLSRVLNNLHFSQPSEDRGTSIMKGSGLKVRLFYSQV